MKKQSDFRVMLKEALILFAITLISGLVLGFVHELTKEPILKQEEKAVQEACKAVFADASAFELYDYDLADYFIEELNDMGVKPGKVFLAKDSAGECMGFVIETTTTRGYGGNIVIYSGITTSLSCKDISILSISETPGLGMQAEKVLVPQFHNKTADRFEYTKTGARADNEIDAISGATITTKAVTNAVNGALMIAEEVKGGVQ